MKRYIAYLTLPLLFMQPFMKSGATPSLTAHFEAQTAADEAIAGEEILDAEDIYFMGLAHYFGTERHEKDFEKAATWLLKAAQKGHIEAINQVGEMYLEGQGFLYNEHRALQWLRKAAEKGHPDALYNLGHLYWTSSSTLRNDELAYKYLKAATEKEHPIAHFYLGAMQFNGHGISADTDLAIATWMNGVRLRCAPCPYHIGTLFLDGIGVEKNKVTALSWFFVASAFKHGPATQAVDSLRSKMTTDEVISAEILSKAWLGFLQKPGAI